MLRRRRLRWLLAGGIAMVLLATSTPWILRASWRQRSSNPVHRGVVLANALGCFTCHGELGTAGIADPSHPAGVPAWSGGEWMMHVENDDDIRRIILEGDPADGTIAMPAYANIIDSGELNDLVAAFKVVSGMTGPPRDSPARSGYELAGQWNCLACHGPAASGGLPNPRSFTGAVPGWYGPAFKDLVQDRNEFDEWILEGNIKRLTRSRLANYFLRRQKLSMPSYPDLSPQQLDDLWSYTQWLEATEGGHKADPLGY
jgi:mono/diheme cytochrome c family protein